jgi:hypothetical protein
MQRHYVNYYKGEQLYETNRRETALTHPRDNLSLCFNHEYLKCASKKYFKIITENYKRSCFFGKNIIKIE